MSRISYGYKVKYGSILIKEKEAKTLRLVFRAYLDEPSLSSTIRKMNLPFNHSQLARLLRNPIYLGDDIYPAIVQYELFEAVQEKRQEQIAKSSGRGRTKEVKPPVIATTFTLRDEKEFFDDPAQEAEYRYSLIESEVL